MMDMVREMYEDGRKSSRLREQLNSMKEEKQLLSDKLQGNGEATSYCKYEPEKDA